MKVLVTGGRSYHDKYRLWFELDALNKPRTIELIIHGACPTGADAFAAEWANMSLVEHTGEKYRPDWAKHGKAAGPIRNNEMLRFEHPDVVLVFPGGRGTADCERQARKLGLNVVVVK